MTSADSGSTASPPHVASTLPAVDSSDTDWPVTTGRDAADRDDIADQSQICSDNSQPTAAVGSETVLSAASVDNELSSGDKIESTGSKNIESHKEGIETASAENIDSHNEDVETATVAETSDVTESAKNVESHEEDVKTSSAAETSKSVEKSSEAETEVGDVGVDDGATGTNQSTADDVTSPSCEQTTATTEKTPTPPENSIDDASLADFLALSYLVHPPDGSTFDQPYVDSFWQCRWQRMEPEIRRVLRKSSRLASDVITLDSSSSEFDSSEGEYSDELEDSMASNSPIFVQEKKTTTNDGVEVDDGVGDGDDACEEIVLDENSSNAIVVGDDEDDDDVDEIICSGENNEDEKNGDASIVLCEGENSSPPQSGAEPSVTRPQDIESSNCSSSVVGVDSTADVDAASDKCGESVKVANGSAGVQDATVKTDVPGCDSEPGKDADGAVVSNGACCVDEAGDS